MYQINDFLSPIIRYLIRLVYKEIDNDTVNSIDCAKRILYAVYAATDTSVDFFRLENVAPILEFLSLEPSAADVASFFIFSVLKTAETQQQRIPTQLSLEQ